MLRPLAATLLALASLAVAVPVAAQTAVGSEELVIVKMVEKSATVFVFEPASITVRRGQTIRFVQEGIQPHNVEFRDPPDGASLTEIAMGPFLVQRGQTYDVVIDGRFSDGTYPYVCTPHEAMGMKGTIVVEAASGPGR